MENYNKGKKFDGGRGGKKFGGGFGGNRGGNRDSGGNRGFGGGGERRDRPDMHKAVCSDCGKSCEVPFRPTGDKPVFCSDCFGNKGGGNSRDSRGGGNRDFRGGGDRDSRPRFGDNKSNQGGGGNAENYKAQFEQLSTKLDKILRLLNPDGFKETTETSKSKKFQKDPNKKIVDVIALKDVITEAVDEDFTTKKVANKKSNTKKATPKKTLQQAQGKKPTAKKPVTKKKKK